MKESASWNRDSLLRKVAADSYEQQIPEYNAVKEVLTLAMQAVAIEIVELWDSDRYVREEFAFD